ncbi:uncharacterized protein LOC127855005 [Dreissena polymorpha]|uniref:Apple domain-containing protein n=1 Tax=Dreissena polymorpha TaxID=45954 RepID=A0A9D4C9F4_DREPO|nr:uncharacterized protein LOC127855005 [Dreissena polymorpha]KAH3719398.1 hypothetical protein DPMN_062230 [Dreissena polymorpha]
MLQTTKMHYTLLILVNVLYTVTGHDENDPKISKLQVNADREWKIQEDIAKNLATLSAEVDRLKAQADNLEREGAKHRSLDTAALRQQHRLERIEKLVRDIRNLEDYLTDDGALDKHFVNLNVTVEKEIDAKIKVVNDRVGQMNAKIKEDLGGVGTITDRIEQTADKRNVVVGGVVYYMGIGSACTEDVDICRVGKSECREGICQCEPGLSSDSLRQTCVDKCEGGYGRSYQTVNNYAIRGYNNMELLNVTLENCKARCEAANAFVCRTFDYFPDWKSCYLSEKVKSDVEPVKAFPSNDGTYDADLDVRDKEDGWEYNGAAIHFQRDCRI